MKLLTSLSLAALVLTSGCMSTKTDFRGPVVVMAPPAPMREFRGLWIPTVNNSNWPSEPGLPIEKQKAELLVYLDLAVRLHLNAIFFQVRPDCDALYESKIEPWSEVLTGTNGKNPGYDPLKFAIAEAHKRGLELHAWLNPYRVRLLKNSNVAKTDVSFTHPNIVRTYGKYLWLDPTEPETRAYSLSVIRDIIKRYDVDGIHFDDYFYPYQEHEKTGPDDKKGKGKLINFPDDKAWVAYQSTGGKMSRNDWRRENVNDFVQQVDHAIKAQKNWVKFGISPFGIWQPGYPKPIQGLNSYDTLYSDSRKWLAEGWVDYLAPQLYWKISSAHQSYPALLNWWEEQNTLHRHLWPGIVAVPAEESSAQIALTRTNNQTDPGVILWHAKPLRENRDGLADKLASGIYAHPALVPSSPWLSVTPPDAPKVKTRHKNGTIQLKWKTSDKIAQWVLQEKTGDQWTVKILPGPQKNCTITGLSETIYLSAMDRYGNLSESVTVK